MFVLLLHNSSLPTGEKDHESLLDKAKHILHKK